ncbi:MAG: hypothetical protein ACXWTP_03340 [Methylosarcina sp.]
MRPDLFIHTITNLRHGETQSELSAELHSAVQAAIDTGKTAELTLTIKIKPEANGRQIFISDKISAKIPTLPREQTILFPTKDGNLQRDDPRQMSIPGLRTIEAEKPTEFKTAQG